MGYYRSHAELYGTVRDKKTAIRLLCEESWYWYALDEELKKDIEVKMFFQPKGYRLEYEFNGNCYRDFVVYYCEEGFKKNFGEDDLGKKEALFYPSEFWLYGDDEKQYSDIQRKMISKAKNRCGDYEDLILFNKHVYSCSSEYDGLSCPWKSCDGNWVCIFDRKCLQELAAPYLNGQTEKIFVKK